MPLHLTCFLRTNHRSKVTSASRTAYLFIYLFIVNSAALVGIFDIFGKENKKVNLNSLWNPLICPPK